MTGAEMTEMAVEVVEVVMKEVEVTVAGSATDDTCRACGTCQPRRNDQSLPCNRYTMERCCYTCACHPRPGWAWGMRGQAAAHLPHEHRSEQCAVLRVPRVLRGVCEE